MKQVTRIKKERKAAKDRGLDLAPGVFQEDGAYVAVCKKTGEQVTVEPDAPAVETPKVEIPQEPLKWYEVKPDPNIQVRYRHGGQIHRVRKVTNSTILTEREGSKALCGWNPSVFQKYVEKGAMLPV